jgi:DNA processing protein
MSDLQVYLCAFARLFHEVPAIGRRVVQQAGSVSRVFQLTRQDLCEQQLLFNEIGGLPAPVQRLLKFRDWKSCERDAELCREQGIKILPYNDRDYPSLLRMIDDPPMVLFVRGDVGLLGDGPLIGIVGARKASHAGKDKAYEIAHDLAQLGIVVTSGMAFGIDAAAHRGALDAEGATVAVWGTGPDIVYPRTNARLARRIASMGAIVTEFPPGVGSHPHHFPQRNRIVSGLSLGVIVVEAAEKSGSLITARFALEQGRDVCVVPGAAGQLNFGGSNRLIREGAALVENAQDVVNTIFPAQTVPSRSKKAGQGKISSVKETRPENCDKVLNHFEGVDSLSIDELVVLTGRKTAEVLEHVAKLEMAEKLEELPGHRYRIKR